MAIESGCGGYPIDFAMVENGMRHLLIGALFCALPLFGQSLSGTYKGEVSTSSGNVENKLVLKVEGKSLTGTLTNQYGELPLKDGAVDGEDLFFVVVVKDEGQDFRMVYRGHAFGGEIQFRIEAGERQIDLIAKKVT